MQHGRQGGSPGGSAAHGSVPVNAVMTPLQYRQQQQMAPAAAALVMPDAAGARAATGAA
eukprot:CAMPEP_0118862622 /NCGR_PEP_ID=MMETSP1163-20130328/7760_1 /TAXON_ID=124430 /ORGANISM="Phaeomonas parva, Strain CCMP2877" /LENGTH=58 /DNA_ID=CAMNT_0006796541 /DNA_START=185 /DNA_END=357 /DNA_ORIENTATION=+